MSQIRKKIAIQSDNPERLSSQAKVAYHSSSWASINGESRDGYTLDCNQRGIIDEFKQLEEHLSAIKPIITFLGSARITPQHTHYQWTESLAHQLSQMGYHILTGGGPGVMEAANKGGYRGKSLSIGLNIQLPQEQEANAFQDISLNFQNFFTRKLGLFAYSEAIILLPGGLGTLDELANLLLLFQTQKLKPRPIFIVQKDFWAPLNQFLQDMLNNNFISPRDLECLVYADDAQRILEKIKTAV